MTDPFGTAALRSAVLDAWAASPTRFREDANAEEDLRLGGYADTWFVELVQNAADAAGDAGRVRVRLVDAVGVEVGFDGASSGGLELRIANTGGPLTGSGVAALASLRASAKREDTGAVGRFGVGFSAVLAVSDAPRVVSTSGSVAFSAARTAEAVATLPGPAEELARRAEPPVLRLVWPSDERPPAGFATEVRLPLRPVVDGSALLADARALAPDLLLALPALAEIDVAGHAARRTERDGIVTVGALRWRVVRRTGDHGADAVAGAAVEQRGRRAWAVTWALPLDAALGDDVAHAPTDTAEAMELPARLIATLPLEPDRRRVRPGAATDAVVDGAAAAYVDLVRAVAPDERSAMVPAPGFPRSPLHGHLRARIVAALRGSAWLPAPVVEECHPAAMGREECHPAAVRELVPERAEWLDVPGVGPVLARLLAAAGFDRLAAPPYVPTALGELGARRVGVAELVERLFGVERPAHWWRGVYAELAELVDTVPGLLDDLRALPVPLVDGRVAAGPATVLLPETAAAQRLAGLALPGLHVAHPDAAHPLLHRLGARAADPAAVLEHPAVRTAIDRSVDDAEAGLDPAPLAEAVLALVAAGGPAAEPLAALALPAQDGRPARADELMLPDAVLRPLLAADGPLDVLDAEWAGRFPREVLVAVGVLDGFAVVVDEEPLGPDHDLDDEDRWWDSLDAPPQHLVAVRDLDLVDDAAWPAALALLAGDRTTRAAAVGGYTAWWLARHARLGGHRPGHWRLPSATAIGALYDPLPPPPRLAAGREECHPAAKGREECHPAAFPATPAAPADEGLLVAIGVRRDLHVACARSANDLLTRLADPRRRPAAALAAAAHVALLDAVADGRVDVADLDLPERVRAMDGAVAPVDVAAVLDAPWPAAVLPAGELVIGGDPRALADLLDLPLASAVVVGDVEGDGEPVTWSELGEIVVACHTLGIEVPDGGLRRHRQLWVALRRPVTGRRRVPVWRDAAGEWHAEDPVRALLALLAR